LIVEVNGWPNRSSQMWTRMFITYNMYLCSPIRLYNVLIVIAAILEIKRKHLISCKNTNCEKTYQFLIFSPAALRNSVNGHNVLCWNWWASTFRQIAVKYLIWWISLKIDSSMQMVLLSWQLLNYFYSWLCLWLMFISRYALIFVCLCVQTSHLISLFFIVTFLYTCYFSSDNSLVWILPALYLVMTFNYYWLNDSQNTYTFGI